MKMKCFLIGSKELSVRVLEALVESRMEVSGVLSRDHEPGMKVWHRGLGHRSLEARAGELGVRVFKGVNVNDEEILHFLAAEKVDYLFSCFWGEMVKTPVLNIPRIGAFNLHTAYLPKNRGSFPIPWALIEGESHTGLTIHKMFPGVDDGHIVSQVKVPIEETDNGASLYQKVTDAGEALFKRALPQFLDLGFTLTPPDEAAATYHPRGYPYGGQIGPYWPKEKKERFIRALDFPPFPAHTPAPPKYLQGKKEAGVRVMIGFDNDRPRGVFAMSAKGREMAERKIHSLEKVTHTLERLQLPRTFFICGLFLETMYYLYGERARNAFLPASALVDIADHTYSHNVVKAIKTRPDKIPMSPKMVAEEFDRNTALFKEILQLKKATRGFRTPLGHYRGLTGAYRLMDTLHRKGIPYVSSDLRDIRHSLHPPLKWEDGIPRQPYRYENGLLEIPSMGWQDTVFSGTSRTKVFDEAPRTYREIMAYLEKSIREAAAIAREHDRDYFYGLVLHPYDVSFYDKEGRFFPDLKKIVEASNGSFCSYQATADHYNATLHT